MRTVTLARFEIIKQAHPNAHIETRDGVEYVVIPTYDFDHDVSGEQLLRLERGERAPSFKPGDTLRHTKTGSPFNIVDPFKAFLKLRKGRKTEDDGQN